MRIFIFSGIEVFVIEAGRLIEFLSIIEKLKCNTRHSWTSSNRQESVADHSWRLAIMAILIKDEFPSLDMNKVVMMCLIHDWGEAVTGDIPVFLKNTIDENHEDAAISTLITMLPSEKEYKDLFEEMRQRQTDEAKLWKALDMLEALIQHNEADIKTWLPLEHDLQLTYGLSECSEFEYTKELRELIKVESLRKISEHHAQ